jgi:hypothetical protein
VATARLDSEPIKSPTTVDTNLAITLTFYDQTPAKTRDYVCHVILPIRANSNISGFEHLLTLFDYNANRAFLLVNSTPARPFHFQFTSPTVGHSFFSLLLSFLGVVTLVIVYFFYRNEFRDESWERLPPECTLMSYSNFFLFLGSDVWHYVLPFASPPAIWIFTRSVAALWVWFERLILYALAKGRNVLERRTVSPREVVIFSLFAVVDVCRAVVNCQRHFEAPFGAGTASTAAAAFASLVALAGWAVVVVCGWKRDWFFALFFLLITAGSALGPVAADVLGLFRETYFRAYEALLPIVIALFLYLVTWPVSGITPADQREGRRYDGGAMYQ